MKKLLTAMMLLTTLSAWAEEPQATPKIGQDFERTAQAIRTENPKKIEVVEIFWYGCIHCYHMDPVIEAWSKKLPADVTFRRLPGLPNPSWAPMTKTYYTLESLNLLQKLHTPLFEAVHKQKVLNPVKEEEAIAWITKQSGLDKKKVEETFNSFTMNNKLNQAALFFRNSGATGVPSIVIDGQFITSSTMAGGNEQALKVTDYIIANIRADKAASAKK